MSATAPARTIGSVRRMKLTERYLAWLDTLVERLNDLFAERL